MARLTKKRKAELLKEYPDPDAIGRAFAQDFIDARIEDEQAGYKHVLTQDELNYLLEVLPSLVHNEEELEGYNRHVRLRHALVKLINTWRTYFYLFSTKNYTLLYYMQGVSIGFQALNFTKDVPDDFKKLCEKELKNMSDNLNEVWEEFQFAIKALYYADFIIVTLEEEFGLDFTVMRPNIALYEENFKGVQEHATETLNILEKYKKNPHIKGKIHFISARSEELKTIQEADINTLKITLDKKMIIQKLLEKQGVDVRFIDDALEIVDNGGRNEENCIKR